MKFHLISGDDHMEFVNNLSAAAQDPPEGYFVQDVKFTCVYSESAAHLQIWSALIVFGEIPTR